MKILLVRVKPHKETIGLQHVMICEPLELEYLVSNHGTESDVEIIDLIVEKRKLDFFIEDRKPDLVVFSGYISHVNRIIESARSVKLMASSIKTMVGGVHAEVNPTDFINPAIDYIACANGIDTFSEVIKHLEKGETDIIEKVSGLYKEDRVYLKKNVFNYNHPDRSSVSKYRKSYYYMFHNPCALMKTSYGCPYACAFCFCKEITGGQYYQREISDVIAEIKDIKEKEIYIVDDNFLYDRDRLIRFMDLLKQNKIEKKFLVYGRADFIAENEDIMAELKEVGLRAVIVGLESHSDDALDKYNKHSSLAINEKAVAILQRYDIELYATLIIPMDFRKEDFKSLGDWLNRLSITFVNLQPLTPLKGTSIYHDYKKHFIIPENQYEKWDLAHVVLKPEFISIRQFYLYLLWTYYRVVMRPKKVMRLIRKYGIKENIKMMFGSSRVSMQYLSKLMRGV